MPNRLRVFMFDKMKQIMGLELFFAEHLSRHKKVVLLIDNASLSAGDVMPHLFLGEKLDGNLGSNTSCKIIGDIDGRLKGSISNRNPMPVSEFITVYHSSDWSAFFSYFLRC